MRSFLRAADKDAGYFVVVPTERLVDQGDMEVELSCVFRLELSDTGPTPGSSRGKARGKAKAPASLVDKGKQGPRCLAVTVGFEPTLAFTPNNISSVAPSAARTRHQPD